MSELFPNPAFDATPNWAARRQPRSGTQTLRSLVRRLGSIDAETVLTPVLAAAFLAGTCVVLHALWAGTRFS